jgi:hypothetical protein
MSIDVQTATGNWGHWADSGDGRGASFERSNIANANDHSRGSVQVGEVKYDTSRQIGSVNKELALQMFEQERVSTRLNYEQQITMAKEFAVINARLDGVEKTALASRLADAQIALGKSEQTQALAAQTLAIVAAIKALIP